MKSKLYTPTVSIVLLACAASFGLTGQAQAQHYRAGSTYANPDQTTTNVWRQKGPCSDPWVSIALEAVYGRAESWRCNVKLYNNGNWRDYNELVQAVAKVKNYPTIDMSRVKAVQIDADTINLSSNNGVAIGQVKAGQITVSLPPNLVAANMVAAGAGNMVAAGAGNMVAAGAGNMVAAGAGNLKYAVTSIIEKNPPPIDYKDNSGKDKAKTYGLMSVKTFDDLKKLSKK
jgi:hypothetical protein